MSHYVCEIVIPPTNDIEASIRQIMHYFCDEKYDASGNEVGREDAAEWWDFYVIGGRFNGHKTQATLDPKRLEAFYAALKELKVTVSGMQCGKQSLEPASQIPMVNELWREFFPGKGDKCVLFAHSNDQYGRDGIYANDICTVADVPDNLECERLIVAGPHWDKEKHPNDIEPKRMVVTEYWNRIEHQKSDFDGKVKPALAMFAAEERDYKKVGVKPDWLVVTVDYHN